MSAGRERGHKDSWVSRSDAPRGRGRLASSSGARHFATRYIGNAYVTREGGILAPFFYPEADLRPKAVGSGEEGQGSRLFPHPQLEVGGLGPGHPEEAMPTSGQEGGRGGGRGGPRPWPQPT